MPLQRIIANFKRREAFALETNKIFNDFENDFDSSYIKLKVSTAVIQDVELKYRKFYSPKWTKGLKPNLIIFWVEIVLFIALCFMIFLRTLIK